MRALLFDTPNGDTERRWAISCGAIMEMLPVVRWREIEAQRLAAERAGR